MRILAVVTALVVLPACRADTFFGEAGEVEFIAPLQPLGRGWSPGSGVARPTEVDVCVASVVHEGGPLEVEPSGARVEPASEHAQCSRVRIDTTDVRVDWSGTMRTEVLFGDPLLEKVADGFTFRPAIVDAVVVVDPLSQAVLSFTDPPRDLDARLPAEVGIVPGVMWSGWFVPLDGIGRPIGFELARASATSDSETIRARVKDGFVELWALPGATGKATVRLSYDGLEVGRFDVFALGLDDVARLRVERIGELGFVRAHAFTRSGLPVLQPRVEWRADPDLELVSAAASCRDLDSIERCANPDADPLEVPDRPDVVRVSSRADRTNTTNRLAPVTAGIPGTSMEATLEFFVSVPTERRTPPAAPPPPAPFPFNCATSSPVWPTLLLTLVHGLRRRPTSAGKGL